MDEVSAVRRPVLEEVELGMDTVEVDGGTATDASMLPLCIPPVPVEADELDEPPPEEPDPFCAETQRLQERIAARQTEVLFSNCIGTPPRKAARRAGRPSSSTSYSRTPADGRRVQVKFDVGANVTEL
jgi:hypothetical protein